MSVGDIFKRRLKTSAASLGTGTPSESNFLRGDGAWETPVTASDVSNLENTLTMIAWDTYSADNTFDDIYVDNFADATGIDGTVGANGILSGNSTGVYSTAFESVELTNLTQDISTSQISCATWSDINSVAVTQTTPGDITASAIYHAVSFDNAVTYKVFKTTWQTVAYNNGGTWQYNNAGSLTNASSNTLTQALIQSTNQSAYQWTKANVEAVSDADWNASGGWSASVTTVDWAHRDVTGYSWTIAGGATTATETLSAAGASPNAFALASDYYTTYTPWKLFDGSTGQWYTTNTTAWVMYGFPSGTTKIIKKYSMKNRYDTAGFFPLSWTLQASNNTTNGTDGDWTTLDTQTNVTEPALSGWFESGTLSNTTAYRYYKIDITEARAVGDICFEEIKLIEASTATPEFTKSTLNYDSDHIPLSLISNSWEASVNDPVDAYCVLDVEPVDAITLNTDLLAYASIDNGAHYEQITLEATPFREIGDHDYVRGDLTGITARTDKTIRIKVTSANSKALKLHAWAIGVKY